MTNRFWYDMIDRLSRETSRIPLTRKRRQARSKKLFKKVDEKRLTNFPEYGMIGRLSHKEHRTMFGLTQIKNWIEGNELNIFAKKMFESFCQLTFSTQVLKEQSANNVRAVVRKNSFKQLNLRVWFWLRMNAGGVLNTCKSNGHRGACSSMLVADGWVTREQPAHIRGITQWKLC